MIEYLDSLGTATAVSIVTIAVFFTGFILGALFRDRLDDYGVYLGERLRIQMSLRKAGRLDDHARAAIWEEENFLERIFRRAIDSKANKPENNC